MNYKTLCSITKFRYLHKERKKKKAREKLRLRFSQFSVISNLIAEEADCIQ